MTSTCFLAMSMMTQFLLYLSQIWRHSTIKRGHVIVVRRYIKVIKMLGTVNFVLSVSVRNVGRRQGNFLAAPKEVISAAYVTENFSSKKSLKRKISKLKPKQCSSSAKEA